MDVLATCHANSVLLAIALAASSSACDGSTSANPPRAASGPTEPGSSAEPEARIDADIARFVASDAVVRVQKRGDLDDDGRQDVLLVLQKQGAESSPRTLMILRGAADGSFEQVVGNPDAILCQSCGGMMGDPLSEVEVHPGGFVLAFEGGSRELWSRTYGFAYSQAKDGWYLERVDMKVLDRIDGRGDGKSATGEQIGVVSIADFDAASMAQDEGI